MRISLPEKKRAVSAPQSRIARGRLRALLVLKKVQPLLPSIPPVARAVRSCFAVSRVRAAIVNSRAQAAFELMLVLPIFIPVVLLSVDFGTMMYEYVSISNAVSEGARYASVNCETGTCSVALIQQRTADRSGGIIGDTAEVTVGWRDVNGNSGDGTTGKGDSVVVKVTHPYHFLFFPHTMNVSACADYRLEQQDQGSNLPAGTGC